jgi:hypothetical protein
MLWGPEAGSVVRLPLAAARPLLADGQAQLLADAGTPRFDRISARQDRGMPRRRQPERR